MGRKNIQIAAQSQKLQQKRPNCRVKRPNCRVKYARRVNTMNPLLDNFMKIDEIYDHSLQFVKILLGGTKAWPNYNNYYFAMIFFKLKILTVIAVTKSFSAYLNS